MFQTVFFVNRILMCLLTLNTGKVLKTKALFQLVRNEQISTHCAWNNLHLDLLPTFYLKYWVISYVFRVEQELYIWGNLYYQTTDSICFEALGFSCFMNIMLTLGNTVWIDPMVCIVLLSRTFLTMLLCNRNIHSYLSFLLVPNLIN